MDYVEKKFDFGGSPPGQPHSPSLMASPQERHVLSWLREKASDHAVDLSYSCSGRNLTHP